MALLIGLTGGIASGKTTAANHIAQMGMVVVDTDQIAHDLTQIDTAYYQSITEHFGFDALKTTPGKSLNRRQLRHIVFSNPKELAWLENLLHPPIVKDMLQKLSQAQSPYAVAVVPLLLELGLQKHFKRILWIKCNKNNQAVRAKGRDALSSELLSAIFARQADAECYQRYADDVIDNNGSKQQMLIHLHSLHQQYLKLSQA